MTWMEDGPKPRTDPIAFGVDLYKGMDQDIFSHFI